MHGGRLTFLTHSANKKTTHPELVETFREFAESSTDSFVVATVECSTDPGTLLRPSRYVQAQLTGLRSRSVSGLRDKQAFWSDHHAVRYDEGHLQHALDSADAVIA
jgi:hypothetical protein